MNVYDVSDDSEPEGQWVKLQGANGLRTFMSYAERAAFFAAHPRIAVERHCEASPKGSKAKLADMTRLDAFRLPVLSERAKAVFEPHLQGLGQWIPLDFDEAPYWLFWLTAVHDVLDAERSDVRYFRDGRRVMRIAKPVFRPAALETLFMWQVLQEPGSFTCVTDSALALVREHRLTGFCFELLWSSNHGPLPDGLKNWERPRLTGLEDKPFDFDGFWAEYGQRRSARAAP